MRDNSDLASVTCMFPPPSVASPGGIPPWEPPEDDSGEWLAYEGWAEWVEAHGNFTHRMQVLTYRFEMAGKVIADALVPAMKTVADAVTKLCAAVNRRADD